MILFLAQHTEIQAAAQEEVDRVLGDSDFVTSEMEKELKYVSNCIKESQRLIPVITGFSRGATEDTELGGKLFNEMKKALHPPPPLISFISLLIFSCCCRKMLLLSNRSGATVIIDVSFTCNGTEVRFGGLEGVGGSGVFYLALPEARQHNRFCQ